MDYYKVDDVSRVQAVLASREGEHQIIKILDVTHDVNCPENIVNFPEFPDVEVRAGTRIYQKFQDGRIFEICVLRG
ncbi:hypothetical protein [uncultured Methanobacterium sp.]|uniref:hypothetical protein n=1 Tax=uncultured Methanobacterium sp. TaxID=176306 RepID=UPI002AA66BD0|nr:hypothetical protein [uncultured Methanobacterium sp.]